MPALFSGNSAALQGRGRPRALTLALAASLAGCVAEPPPRELTARASDETTQEYPLAAGARVDVETRRGAITIDAADTGNVTVRTTRSVRAATEESARDVLPRVSVSDEMSPEGLTLRAEGLTGLVIGVEVETSFAITIPRTATLRARSRTGDVTVTGLDGRAVLNASNGSITGNGLRGAVEARANNGSVTLTFGALGKDPLDIRVTNGSIALQLPSDAAATLQANLTNAAFEIETLPFADIGQRTPRRVRGQINGGGTLVDLTAVNGKIRVTAAPGVPAP